MFMIHPLVCKCQQPKAEVHVRFTKTTEAVVKHRAELEMEYKDVADVAPRNDRVKKFLEETLPGNVTSAVTGFLQEHEVTAKTLKTDLKSLWEPSGVKYRRDDKPSFWADSDSTSEACHCQCALNQGCRSGTPWPPHRIRMRCLS